MSFARVALALTLVLVVGCGRTSSTSTDARRSGTEAGPRSQVTSPRDEPSTADSAAVPSASAKPDAKAIARRYLDAGADAQADAESMVLVPAGRFWMGCSPKDTRCEADESPRHQAQLDAYHIDRHEVTVADYARCVVAGTCTAPTVPRMVRCNWGKEDRGDHPVNCVDWTEAEAYCRWAGKRLPTEAEWEKAARGTDERIYPWGDEEPTCLLATYGDGCGKDRTWPVRAKPEGASAHGLLGMGGNVSEWVSDWYDPAYYATSPGQNPQGPPSGSERVRRDKQFFYQGASADYLRTSRRSSDRPEKRDSGIGIRCARSL